MTEATTPATWNGVGCPWCGDGEGEDRPDLERTPLQRGTDWAWSDARCFRCGHEWAEVYELVGAHEIVRAPGAPSGDDLRETLIPAASCELLLAAIEVVRRWTAGNLAGAVHELDLALQRLGVAVPVELPPSRAPFGQLARLEPEP